MKREPFSKFEGVRCNFSKMSLKLFVVLFQLFGYLQSETEEQDFSAIEDSGVFMVAARKRVGEAAGQFYLEIFNRPINFLAKYTSC